MCTCHSPLPPLPSTNNLSLKSVRFCALKVSHTHTLKIHYYCTHIISYANLQHFVSHLRTTTCWPWYVCSTAHERPLFELCDAHLPFPFLFLCPTYPFYFGLTINCCCNVVKTISSTVSINQTTSSWRWINHF